MDSNTTKKPENHYQLMAQYNQWMNRKIYYVCESIPDADRKKDLGAFFKSIHGTLNHILYGDIAWLERLRDNSITKRNVGQEMFNDFGLLRKEREKTDTEILEWTEILNLEKLNSQHRYTSNVDSKTRELPIWVLVTHMFNHQTHHRGQVTTLIKQLGYDPGVTDIPRIPAFNRNNSRL